MNMNMSLTVGVSIVLYGIGSYVVLYYVCTVRYYNKIMKNIKYCLSDLDNNHSHILSRT